MNLFLRRRSARTIDVSESKIGLRVERQRDRLERSVTRHICSARQPVNSVQRLSERLVAVLITMSRVV